LINHSRAIVKRQLSRLIAADTIALIIHGILGFFFVALNELWLAGIEPEKVFVVRIVYDVLVIVGAYFCGRLADKTRKILQGTSGHPVRKFIAGGVTLSIFKIPIYITCALTFQIQWEQIRIAAGLYFLENMATGWLYLIILDWTRRRFSAKSRGNNP